MEVDEYKLEKSIDQEMCCGKCSSNIFCMEKIRNISKKLKIHEQDNKDVDNNNCFVNFKNNFDNIDIIDSSCDALKIDDGSRDSVKIADSSSDTVNFADSSCDLVKNEGSDRNSRIKNRDHDAKSRDISKYSLNLKAKWLNLLKTKFPEAVIKKLNTSFDAEKISTTELDEIPEPFESLSPVTSLIDESASKIPEPFESLSPVTSLIDESASKIPEPFESLSPVTSLIDESASNIPEPFESLSPVASLVDESALNIKGTDEESNDEQKYLENVDAEGSQQKISVYCDICSLGFTSQSKLDEHLDGSKHKKKQKLIASLKDLEKIDSAEYNSASGVIRCTLCDVTASSPQSLATHLDGQKHKSRERAKRGIEENGTPAKKVCSEATEKNDKINSEEIKGEGKFFCDPCMAHCNSKIQLTQHISSKKHIEKMSGSKAIVDIGSTSSCFSALHTKSNGLQFALSSLKMANTNSATIKRSEIKKENLSYSMNLEPNSTAILTAHLTHRAKKTFRCDICSLEFFSQSALDDHLGGAKHQKKKEFKLLMNIIHETESKYECNSESLVIRCTVCAVVVNSAQMLVEHICSGKHRSKAKRKNEEELLTLARNVISENKHRSCETKNGGINSRSTIGDTSLPPPKKTTVSLRCSISPCAMEFEKTREQVFSNSQAHLNSYVPLSEKLSSKNVFTSESLKGTGYGLVNRGGVATFRDKTANMHSSRTTGNESGVEVSVFSTFGRDEIYVPERRSSPLPLRKGILWNGPLTFRERPLPYREEPVVERQLAVRELPPPFRDLPSPFKKELPPLSKRLQFSTEPPLMKEPKFDLAPGIQQNIQLPVVRNFHTKGQSPSGFFL